MAKKFENIQVGNQLELRLSNASIYEIHKNLDPNKLLSVAVVTHIWFDPIDNKEYVALAYLRKDGSYGKPVEKRTITGLARCGWEYASKDWVAHFQTIDQADKNTVLQFRRTTQ